MSTCLTHIVSGLQRMTSALHVHVWPHEEAISYRMRRSHPLAPPVPLVPHHPSTSATPKAHGPAPPAGGPDPRLLCTQGSERVHPDMPTCAQCHAPVQGNRTSSAFLGWAGGLVCCSETRAAQCPRIWK